MDVVLFALAIGLRHSNVIGLEWSRVDLDTGHTWVDATHSKNRKPIAVPLKATALAVSRRQLGKYPERVFTFRGRPLWREPRQPRRGQLQALLIADSVGVR